MTEDEEERRLARSVAGKMDEITATVGGIKATIGRIEGHFDGIEGGMARMNDHLTRIEGHLDRIDCRFYRFLAWLERRGKLKAKG